MDILKKVMKSISLVVLFSHLWIFSSCIPARAEALGMVVITDMGFTPKTLTFYEGEPVQLIIHNQDDEVHSFVIPKLNLTSPYLMKGEMATLRFTPQETGSFHYHVNASQFGHSGFTGTLIIKKK